MLIENIDLKPYNTFKISVKCRYLFSYTTPEELLQFLSTFSWNGYPHLFLGGGSNLLFTNHFDGIVLLSKITHINVIDSNNDFVFVEAGAGVVFDDLVAWAVENGYGGIENLSHIPGSVGGAPVQNIGAYGVEAKDVIYKVNVISLDTHEKFELSNRECNFDYRDSIFKHQLCSNTVITSVVFRLTKNPLFNIDYGDVSQMVNQLGGESLSNIRKAIIAIRESKLPDYKVLGNAGSFFKNPIVDQLHFETIKSAHPNVPSYNLDHNMVKIPAAWLIESVGMKGFKTKNVAVHDKQPLVLINQGQASGGEILEVANIIINKVSNTFGINLTPEVNII